MAHDGALGLFINVATNFKKPMRASLRQSLSAVLRMRLLNNVRFTISVNEYSSGTMANCQAKVKAFYGDNSKR